MLLPADSPDFDAHERVVWCSDPDAGLLGVIAIHSTRLGPAIGGCRVASYVDEKAALTDALRLSRGMTFKNAMADLAAGGGKAVLCRLPSGAKREVALAKFADAIENLGGAYATAEDVGTSVADMQIISSRTRHVAGLPRTGGRAGGDPSPWTALGVFEAIRVACRRPLNGAKVAVQGLGSVGWRLCEMLHHAGARLVVADVREDRVRAAEMSFGAEQVPVDAIHEAAADVFSPNALGAVLNEQVVMELQAPVICGGANNQLAHASIAQALESRGILYAPDYVVNAGGIINVVAEYFGEPAACVEQRVRAIGPRLAHLLDQARIEGCSPADLADRQARERLAQAPAREYA